MPCKTCNKDIDEGDYCSNRCKDIGNRKEWKAKQVVKPSKKVVN